MLLRSCLLAVLVVVGDGVGDESTYFQVDAFGDEKEMDKWQCEPVLHGKELPLNGLKEGVQVVRPCEMVKSNLHNDFKGKLVAIYLTKEGCTFQEEYEFVAKSNPAAILIAGDNVRVYSFPLSKFVEEKLQVPTCMLSKQDSMSLWRILDGAPTERSGTLYNGNVEKLSLKKEIAFTGDVSVYVDGKLLDLTSLTALIPDDYRHVAVEVTVSSDADTLPAESCFEIDVTDNFDTGVEKAWKCYGDGKLDDEKWRGTFTFDDSHWTSPTTKDKCIQSRVGWKADGVYRYYCRGSRYLSRIKRAGFLYWVIAKDMDFEDAAKLCKSTSSAEKGTLVSIHTPNLNQLLQTLVPSSSGKAFIGLTKTKQNKEVGWIDATKLDFQNWKRQDSKGDCGVILADGQWTSELCVNKLPFICSERIPSKAGTCNNFLTGEKTTLSGNGEPISPKPLPAIDASMSPGTCATGGGYLFLSCCDQTYIEKITTPRLGTLAKTIGANKTKARCYDTLRELSCLECTATQSHFIQWNSYRKGFDVRMCTDTCLAAFSVCKTHASIFSKASDGASFCEIFVENFLQKTIQSPKLVLVDDPGDSCFLLDGSAPQVIDFKPSNGTIGAASSVTTLQVVFDEPIRYLPSIVVRVHKLEDGAQESPFTFRESTISLATSKHVNDTLEVNLGGCIFNKGKYQVIIDDSAIFDLAGNALVTKKFMEDPYFWYLSSSSDCSESGSGPDWTGVHWIIGGVLVTLLMFGMAYAHHLWEMRQVLRNTHTTLLRGANTSQPLPTVEPLLDNSMLSEEDEVTRISQVRDEDSLLEQELTVVS